MLFVDKGSDLKTINFLAKSLPSETLSKALNKTGLVQKEVIVQGKHGTYTQMKWVKASDDQSEQKQSKKQEQTKGKPKREMKPSTPLNLDDGMFKGCVKLGEGEELPEHIIKAGKRPPKGWREVVYNPDPNAKVWVGGKDFQNRPHALYNPKHEEEHADAKFTRVLAGLEIRDDIFNAIKGIKNREVGDCLLLMFHQGTRPGSTKDTGAEVQAYGATTLQGQHVIVDGDEVALDFIGKEGIHHHHVVSDPELKQILINRKEAAGDTGKLFKTRATTCNAVLKALTAPLLGDDQALTCKDLRTMLANKMASEMLSGMPPATTKKQMQETRNKVGDYVCAKLGNRRTMALKSYISPSVFTEHSPEGMKAFTGKAKEGSINET